MVRANMALIVAVLLHVEPAAAFPGGQDCSAWPKSWIEGTSDGPIWECRQAFCVVPGKWSAENPPPLYCGGESQVERNIANCQNEEPIQIGSFCRLCSELSKYEACVKKTTDECTAASAFTSKELEQRKEAYGSVCPRLTPGEALPYLAACQTALDKAVASGDPVQLRSAIGQTTRAGLAQKNHLYPQKLVAAMKLARDALAKEQKATQVRLDYAVSNAADELLTMRTLTRSLLTPTYIDFLRGLLIPDLQNAILDANDAGLADAKIQPARDALAKALAQLDIEYAKAKAQAAIDSAVAADPPVIADLEAAIDEAIKAGLGEEQIGRASDALTSAQPANNYWVPLLIFAFVAIVGLAAVIMHRRAGKEEKLAPAGNALEIGSLGGGGGTSLVTQ